MSGSSVPGLRVGEKGKLAPEKAEEELAGKPQPSVVQLASVDQRAQHPRTAPSSG